MTPDYKKNKLGIKSDKDLNHLVQFILSNSNILTNEHREGIILRLNFLSRKYSCNNYTDLYNVLKKDSKELNELIQYLEKRSRENEQDKSLYLSLARKKNKFNHSSKKKQNKKKVLGKLSIPLEVKSDPIDKSNITLIFNFLSKNKINYEAYKRSYFLRRLNVRLRKTGSLTYQEYLEVLQKNPIEINKLISNLSINVTRFFRDKDLFETLEKKVLPNLFGFKKEGVRIWSAGCAIGAEPYSLAILISRLYSKFKLKKSFILATDIKPEFLVEAKKGIFHRELLSELNPHLIHNFFNMISPNYYRISESIRNSVTFQVHDLHTLHPENNFDLILCRNVLIYFSRIQSEKLIQRFYQALNTSGFLILGKCELIPFSVRPNFKIIDARTRIYQVIK